MLYINYKYIYICALLLTLIANIIVDIQIYLENIYNKILIIE